jgi:hypothetical protein
MVLAATVSIHGASFVSVIGPGPALPAEMLTNTPFSTAPNVPIATMSW